MSSLPCLRTALALCISALVPLGCGGDSGSGPPPGGNAKWTIMVYMAADNNLAVAGIQDIDEMEAAGVDANVNVVVQAEFSPTELAQRNCTAACFNRPNFNTFRYAVIGGASVTGPNGAATDIGNRDMTDPAQLKEFIQFAKQNYPADRYILVLWNHGGGYTGLLADETSSGGNPMSVGDLTTALAGVGPIDIIDFDMCLMGGYETLVKVKDFTDFVVFSEQVVPGEGNPYEEIVNAVQGNPNGTTRAVADAFVEQFHASYSGNRASTTYSAYDIAGFTAFEAALNTLAGSLQTNLGALASSISTASAGSQKYQFPQLTDVASFLDSLRARVGDATIQGQIDAVKTLVLGTTFRIKSRARNGSSAAIGSADDVTRSTGLSIVMPSGLGNDQLPSSGPASFTAYQALYPGAAWTQFLTAYLSGAGTTTYVDQGNSRFEAYLVWDTAAVATGADVDFWILEPNGNVFIPFLGTITPNGALTKDSYDAHVAFEGYFTNRYIEAGTYIFYANLWTDPANFKPRFDLAYRTDQVSSFVPLYDPNFPRLSLDTSWLNDPTPTFGEINANSYSDLRPVAVLTAPTAPGVARFQLLPQERRPAVVGAGPTPAQLERVRQLFRARSAARGSALPSSGAASQLPFPKSWGLP